MNYKDFEKDVNTITQEYEDYYREESDILEEQYYDFLMDMEKDED